MCYSAMAAQNLRMLRQMFGAKVKLSDYKHLFAKRLQDDSIKIPKAMEANFLHPESAEEESIAELIRRYYCARTKDLEEGLFKQKKRLADATRKLQDKETKAALNDQRIATTKIDWHLEKIADLKRADLKARDSRIFPQVYASVVVVEDGEKVIKPMRYLLRRAGKPASDDIKYPGCYNGRRDNLAAFWKAQFGHTHGVFLVDSFYENVSRHVYEKRELTPGEKEQNLVLHFQPRPAQPMVVACLWSHWEGGEGSALDSFAAITDEPPPEVSAAGHDRCVVQLRPENVNSWLNPEGQDQAALLALLDDRQLPFYAHQLAA